MSCLCVVLRGASTFSVVSHATCEPSMAPRAAATRAPLRQDCLEELQILAKVRFREKQARVTFDRERVSVEQMIDTVHPSWCPRLAQSDRAHSLRVQTSLARYTYEHGPRLEG